MRAAAMGLSPFDVSDRDAYLQRLARLTTSGDDAERMAAIQTRETAAAASTALSLHDAFTARKRLVGACVAAQAEVSATRRKRHAYEAIKAQFPNASCHVPDAVVQRAVEWLHSREREVAPETWVETAVRVAELSAVAENHINEAMAAAREAEQAQARQHTEHEERLSNMRLELAMLREQEANTTQALQDLETGKGDSKLVLKEAERNVLAWWLGACRAATWLTVPRVATALDEALQGKLSDPPTRDATIEAPSRMTQATMDMLVAHLPPYVTWTQKRCSVRIAPQHIVNMQAKLGLWVSWEEVWVTLLQIWLEWSRVHTAEAAQALQDAIDSWATQAWWGSMVGSIVRKRRTEPLRLAYNMARKLEHAVSVSTRLVDPSTSFNAKLELLSALGTSAGARERYSFKVAVLHTLHDLFKRDGDARNQLQIAFNTVQRQRRIMQTALQQEEEHVVSAVCAPPTGNAALEARVHTLCAESLGSGGGISSACVFSWTLDAMDEQATRRVMETHALSSGRVTHEGRDVLLSALPSLVARDLSHAFETFMTVVQRQRRLSQTPIIASKQEGNG